MINRKLVEYMLKKNMENKLEGSTNSVLMQNLLESWLKIDAKLQRYQKEAEKIPYRCGWYEGIGLECVNKNPYKENYCPCTICLRYKPLPKTEE